MSDLRTFLEAALERGASDQLLASLLKSQGWPEKEIYAAFREHYEQQTGVTLPARRQAGESAREAFLYLSAFAALATWTVALGSLAFKLIEHWIPDPVLLAAGGAPQAAYASFDIAWLLVAFPLFIYLSRLINRGLAADPASRHSSARKWLTYLSLVLAGGVLAGDAVAVLASLLQGEMTVRFLLKAAVVLAIAGGIFTYYLREVGTAEPRHRRRYLGAATAAVAAAIVLGFSASRSPAAARAARADLERVGDLAQIANALSRDQTSVPANAEEFRARIGPGARLDDPMTGQPYAYRAVGGTRYELCATFETDNRGNPGGRTPFWRHRQGLHCFPFDVKSTVAWP